MVLITLSTADHVALQALGGNASGSGDAGTQPSTHLTLPPVVAASSGIPPTGGPDAASGETTATLVEGAAKGKVSLIKLLSMAKKPQLLRSE